MAMKTLGQNPVDAYIGQRMQLRRNMMGITQKDLANICGVTFQQIQKYETAANRISASRLFQIGMALETPVSFFFSGLPNQSAYMEHVKKTKVSEPAENDPLSKNESLQLITLYWKLPNDEMRENVLKLLKSMNGIK